MKSSAEKITSIIGHSALKDKSCFFLARVEGSDIPKVFSVDQIPKEKHYLIDKYYRSNPQDITKGTHQNQKLDDQIKTDKNIKSKQKNDEYLKMQQLVYEKRKTVIVLGAKKDEKGNLVFAIEKDGLVEWVDNYNMKLNYLNELVQFYENSITLVEPIL